MIAQLAPLLLELGELDRTGQCCVRLSHTTLAHLLGARRQSVTRVFAELRTRGVVSTSYGVTFVEDPEGLREVMGAEPLPEGE